MWRELRGRNRRLGVAIFFLLVALASLVGAAVLSVARADYDDSRIAELQELARRKTVAGAARIDTGLLVTQTKGNQLVEGLNSGEITSANAAETTQQLLRESPNLRSIGIAYDRRLPTAPASANNYATRVGGVVTAGAIPYDYDDPDEPRGHWWRRAIEVGSTWVPPDQDPMLDKMAAIYVGRFYGPEAPPDGVPAGVVIVTFLLDVVNSGVQSSEFGSSGYGFVVSRSGSYPDHPTKGVDGGFVGYPVKSHWAVPGGPTFAEVVEENGNDAAMRILLEDDPSTLQPIDYRDEVTGEASWLFAAPIPNADWVTGFVAVRDVLLADDQTLYRYDIGIGLCVINAATSLLIALGVALLRDTRRVWFIAIVLTITPTFGIGMIWHSALSMTDRLREGPSAADDVSEIDEYGALGDLTAILAGYADYVSSVSPNLRPAQVLTGVFVQSVQPDSDSSAWNAAGTIWQRYPGGIPEGWDPGFVFPDAVRPAELEPLYDFDNGDSRTIGWRFAVSVEPRKSLGEYPLDEMELTLRMAHREVGRPIVLLPDVTEYDLILPATLPGVGPEVSADDFDVVESYFGYTATTVNSTFGIDGFARQRSAPELTFTVHLSRKFLDPFISQTLPLTVMLVLLFAAHVAGTRAGEWTLVADPEKVSRGLRGRAWGAGIPSSNTWDETEVDEPAHSTFYVQSTLTAVLALMFIAILSHNSLRESIGASQITYIEYAYFILYAVMMLVALNSLLFHTGRGGPLVHWRSNLLPELMYWPAVMTALFGATLWAFW